MQSSAHRGRERAGPLGEAQRELLAHGRVRRDAAAVVIEGQAAAQQHERDNTQSLRACLV